MACRYYVIVEAAKDLEFVSTALAVPLTLVDPGRDVVVVYTIMIRR